MKKIVYIIVILVIIIGGMFIFSSNSNEAKTTIQTQIPNDDQQLFQMNEIAGINKIEQFKTTDDETTGNITNLGLALLDKDKIYYSDDLALWVMNKDGTGARKLVDERAVSIQTTDHAIYYINEDTSEIYCINKDGTQKRKISDDRAYSLNIYKNKIYFMDRYNQLFITAMSLEGKNKTVIHNTIANDMMVYNDYIYYITKDGDLGKIKIDGSDSKLLKTDVMQFDIAKSGVYYTYDPRTPHKPKGLYYLALDSDTEKQLLKETPYSFNVEDNVIYYNHPSKMTLYKMYVDGTGKEQIVGNNSKDINIAGDYIFYKNLEDSKKIYRVNKDGSYRTALNGVTKVTNVMDLSQEIDQLSEKQIIPKLERAYNEGRKIIEKIIKPQMTEYDKVKKIHDYIVLNTKYDIETAENFLRGENSDDNSFTAYGVLINKKGVCQGYAEAAQILFSIAGIHSDIIIGSAKDSDGNYISHMWNIVYVGGKYYMIDTTWDDPVGDVDMLLHDYFLINDEELKKTHNWEYDEYPSCT